MLEQLTARSEVTTLKWRSKFVCSSVDPIKEAKLWVKNNRQRLMRQKTAIVLGVGCGHHLVALQKEFPALKILAIDVIRELIEFSKKEHALDLNSVGFSCISSAQDLANDKNIRSAIATHYAVFTFAPAISTDAASYKAIESALLGRTCEGAILLSQFRPALSEILKTVGKIQKSTELISIKNLEAAISPKTAPETIMHIKILKEMIA